MPAQPPTALSSRPLSGTGPTSRSISRWPERRYEIIPDTTIVTCADNICTLEAEMLFTAHSPARQATSRGRALFSYVVELRAQPLISLESSTVIERF